MEKRYQVFVSSTYADLKDERQKVIQTLMELDCIPAGMEMFPAADQEQLEFIKRVIDDCDYYLLIIGGRYGSTTAEGISYTEQEYDYALSRELKVIALIHENPDEIPHGKSEKDPELAARLQKFRDKVSTNRIIKHWKSADELPGIVALSISKTIKTFPAVGWVRANRVSSEDLLTEINDLRKENDHLETMLSKSPQTSQNSSPTDLADIQDTITLHGSYVSHGSSHPWNTSSTWSALFGCIGPYLAAYPSATKAKLILTDFLFKNSNQSGYSASLDDQDFMTVSLQFQALGLINQTYQKDTAGSMGLFWSATPAGEALTLELRTIRKAESST